MTTTTGESSDPEARYTGEYTWSSTFQEVINRLGSVSTTLADVRSMPEQLAVTPDEAWPML
jgi:hypothetical protein